MSVGIQQTQFSPQHSTSFLLGVIPSAQSWEYTHPDDKQLFVTIFFKNRLEVSNIENNKQYNMSMKTRDRSLKD